MDLSHVAIRGSTQEHLEIFDIDSDLLILKEGSAVLVLEIKAVNFGLLSEQEQEAIIYAYAGFLNSLNFPIQIVIKSKQKDVSEYVASLEKAEARQTNTLLKNQINKYRQFVSQTVKDNNVLDKKFYICIPFSTLEMGLSSASSSLFRRRRLPLPKQEIIDRALTTLLPRRDHVLRQMGRLGLKSRQLTTSELIKLFEEIYNTQPDAAGGPTGKFDQIAGNPAGAAISRANIT